MTKNQKRGRKSLTVLIVLIGIIIATLSSIVEFTINYKWFSEVGYTQIFLKELTTKANVGIPTFIVLTIVLFVYFKALKRVYNRKMLEVESKNVSKKFNKWILLGSMVLSGLLSLLITNNLWYKILEFTNYTAFNIKDPIFKKDMSFYIFKLPLLEEIYSVGVTVLFIIGLVTLSFFVIMFSMKGQQRVIEDLKNRNIDFKNVYKEFVTLASKQIGIIASVFFLLLGFSFVLKTYTLLYSPRGVAYGASYTDLKVTLLVYKISVVLSISSAILTAIAGFRKKIKLALIGPGLLVAVSILGNIAALGIEAFIVSPNQLTKEEPYILDNIKYTQKAYGLDKIEEKSFPVEQNITAESLKNNEITINNIPINDLSPTLSMYNSLQGFRRYYEFKNIDVDRYKIDGKYTQVFLAARELNQEKIDERSRTWINKHLKYTHGFGLAVSPTNKVNEVGQPELIVKNIPPQTDTELKITEPRIYYGELTNDYIITNTKTKEFDYPEGDNNKEVLYGGTAGIPMNFFNKVLFAINQGSARILLSNDITQESKIHLNRNIASRVKKIAPFLEYDKDPYLVINEGKLYWVIDAFTISDRYAYSEPMDQQTKHNYIRNSIKVVVDAYNGTTDFYLVDKDDPIATTYGKIYPGLLKDMSEIPEGIKNNIRYSQTMFDIQSEVYRTYHMKNSTVFYNKEDVWQIANQKQSEQEGDRKVDSSYLIMKLPDGKEEEFVLMVPYTPREKDNMVSWLAALNDGDNYGKLVVYKFPKQKLVYGPMQIEKRIDQDTDISKELTLLDQQGSNVIRGNLLTIPIDNSLIFVEPIYLESTGENRNLPEVKRVIVSYGNKIVMGESLQDSLNQIFDLKPEGEQIETPENQQKPDENKPPVSQNSNQGELIKRANTLFNQAEKAQQNGNWSEYGERLKELKETLRQLEIK